MDSLLINRPSCAFAYLHIYKCTRRMLHIVGLADLATSVPACEVRPLDMDGCTDGRTYTNSIQIKKV